MEGEFGTSLEYLGREKQAIDGCLVTKPNDKHVQNLWGKFGMENANPGIVPRKKLELTDQCRQHGFPDH